MTAAAADHWWFAPAIAAALIAAFVGIVTLVANGRRARKDRQREVFAAAFGDIAAYKEFPYIVRRRRHDTPEEERQRISGELSEVQRRLNHNRAVLKVEAPRVGSAYSRLVDETRRVAGAAIRDGWNLTPLTTDAQVHVRDVDLTPIDPFEEAFLNVMADHLAPMPWWSRAPRRVIAARWRARRNNP